ncbi:hypothetical protein Tco_0156103 [Tanacetum coccineum]
MEFLGSPIHYHAGLVNRCTVRHDASRNMGKEIDVGRHRILHFASYVGPKSIARIGIGAIGPPRPSIDGWYNSSIDRGAGPLGLTIGGGPLLLRGGGPTAGRCRKNGLAWLGTQGVGRRMGVPYGIVWSHVVWAQVVWVPIVCGLRNRICKKKAKTKQNQARNGKDKVKGTDIQKEIQKRPNQARDGKDKVNPKTKSIRSQIIATLKHCNYDLKTAGDHRKVQINELNELRDQAYDNSLIYKEETKKIHDSKIKNRIFNVGDRVLLFNSRLKIFSSKLKTRWTGPFTVTQVFPYGTIELSQTDRPNFKVNGHRLKHYFGGDIPPMVVPDLQTFPMDH